MPGDEELGKKDDDHKPRSTSRMPVWAPRNTPLRWRRRRILLAVLALYLLCVLVKHTPALADWSNQRTTTDYGNAFLTNYGYNYEPASLTEPTGPPPGMRAPRPGEPTPHAFDGQFKFYRLAASLHGASHTNGYREVNRNVLFAVSSLQSASTLLPMVCEMARWSRNYVHAAFVGREDVELDQILAINGIDKIKCPAIWHDARPDFTEYSSDDRAESSVRSALTHIHSFLHPQVVIIDDASSEDDFFIRAVHAKMKAFNMPIIQIPTDKVDTMMWLTRLDAGSLKQWNHPTVDILIQVPPGSSSVSSLLRSIKNADYSGLNLPHITIELPAEIDESVESYLDTFKWPPTGHQNHITTRRRIGSQRATQEESAIRFLELYYPSSLTNSHLLLLSPQAELSSQYYQYLMYTLLEYKYSLFGGDDAANVMGVTLELPPVLLDGKSKLTPPKTADMHSERYTELFAETNSVPFLWQAPNSHATLFFGDKWAELHSFLSNRVAKHSKAPQRRKLVSETLPSWVEYMLEFMRARGYALLYPGATSRDALVTIHDELYRSPEEFSLPPPRAVKGDQSATPKVPYEAFLRGEAPAPAPKMREAHVVSKSRPLHLLLPFNGDLPEIPHLPYLLHKGEAIPHSNVSITASIYADKYREVIGGCKTFEGKHRIVVPGTARDLFCFGDEDASDWEDDVPESVDTDVVDDYREASGDTLLNPNGISTTDSVMATTTPSTTMKFAAVSSPTETESSISKPAIDT